MTDFQAERCDVELGAMWTLGETANAHRAFGLVGVEGMELVGVRCYSSVSVAVTVLH